MLALKRKQEPQRAMVEHDEAATISFPNLGHPFLRVVNWARRMMNDAKPKKDQIGHCILDVLPQDMFRNTTDFLDEESLVKFFIAALGSVPHQYIYTSMARRIVEERFTSLQELVNNPLPVVPPARVPPIVPPSVMEFVGRYVSYINREYAANRLFAETSLANARISQRAEEIDGERPVSGQNESDGGVGNQGIVQVIRCLSSHMAVLHYFRDTIVSNTKQDILWPVWCGKLQLNVSEKAPAFMIATPIWYPSLIRRCKHAFANKYHARTMLYGFDVMGQFELGFNFVLAAVTGISSKDCRELRSVSGTRLGGFGGEGANAFYGMAVVPPIQVRDLLHRVATLQAVFAADRIVDTDLLITQYERIVGAEGVGSSHLFCLWEDRERYSVAARISCQEFTDEVVRLLTTRKSILLLSNLPEYRHAGDWAEPPRMRFTEPMQTQTPRRTKTVTFDSLEIHEHAVIRGDNPSVSSGPPLTISWEAQASHHLTVDEYEASRPPRRYNEEMYVPREIREDWLRHDIVIQKTKMERAASAMGNLMHVMVHKLTKGQSAKVIFNILPRKLSRR